MHLPSLETLAGWCLQDHWLSLALAFLLYAYRWRRSEQGERALAPGASAIASSRFWSAPGPSLYPLAVWALEVTRRTSAAHGSHASVHGQQIVVSTQELAGSLLVLTLLLVVDSAGRRRTSVEPWHWSLYLILAVPLLDWLTASVFWWLNILASG